MYAGCYTLDIYCDHQNHPQYPKRGKWHNTQYTGETKAECIRKARKDGWIFHKDRTQTCPECAVKRKEYNVNN